MTREEFLKYFSDNPVPKISESNKLKGLLPETVPTDSDYLTGQASAFRQGQIDAYNKKPDIAGTLGAISQGLGTAGTFVSAFKDNAKTQDITPDINTIKNYGDTTFDSYNLDSINDVWNSTNDIILPSAQARDLRPSTKSQLFNTGKATLEGAMFGAQYGGLWGGIAGGAAGLLSGVGGMVKANQDAQRKAKYMSALGDMSEDIVGQRYVNSVYDAMFNNTNNLLRQQFAKGGMMPTMSGMDNPDAINSIGAGGTHETNPYGGVPSGIAPDGQFNVVEEEESIQGDYVFSNRMSPSEEELQDALLPTKYAGQTFAKIAEKLSKDADDNPNDPIYRRGKKVNLDRLAGIQETQKVKEQFMQQAMGAMSQGIDPAMMGQEIPQEAPVDVSGMEQVPQEGMVPDMGGMPMMAYGGHKFALGSDKLINTVGKQGYNSLVKYINGIPYNSRNLRDTAHLRFMPAIGAGFGALEAAMADPDYRDIQRLEREAYRTPYTRIQARPSGRYQQHNPIDENYLLNQVGAQLAANRRAATNSGLNSGQILNALSAQGMIDADAVLQARANVAQQNLTNRNNTIQFNNALDSTNNNLAVNIANQNNANAMNRWNTGLGYLDRGVTYRNALDSAIGTARSNTQTNFWNQLGNIGRDKFYYNQAQTSGLMYGSDYMTGLVNYLAEQKAKENEKACGGRMMTKRKRR